MFNVGGGEVLVILLIALIVLGPSRLPDAARTIGKTMGDLRRLSSSFQNEVRTALDTADDPNQVAPRRNLLAKEDLEVPSEGDPHPPRRQPLVAAPAPADEPAIVPAKRAPTKASAAKRAKPKNGTAVDKATPSKATPRRTKPS
jgi:sec-independent protein translocase protein TatB